MRPVALLLFVVLSCLALAQTFPSNLSSTTPLASRNELLANLLTDPVGQSLHQVTIVGGISPTLFTGAENQWNALFGWSFLPNNLRWFLPHPRVIVGTDRVASLRGLCTLARFELYSVDRPAQGAFIVVERQQTKPQNLLRTVILGSLLDGSGSNAVAVSDGAFVNNLVIQLDLDGLLRRATRAC